MERKKKQYVKPRVDVKDVTAETLIAASDPVVKYSKGGSVNSDYEALGKRRGEATYDDEDLW